MHIGQLSIHIGHGAHYAHDGSLHEVEIAEEQEEDSGGFGWIGRPRRRFAQLIAFRFVCLLYFKHFHIKRNTIPSSPIKDYLNSPSKLRHTLALSKQVWSCSLS